MDYTWPDWNANQTGAVTNQIRDRPGAQAANPAGLITGGATGTQNVGVINGVSCVRLINGVNLNGGSVCIIDGAGRFHIPCLSANLKFPFSTHDYLFQRVYAMMRVAATPGDATDCGLDVILGSNAGGPVITGTTKPGWSMTFDTAGGLSLAQRGNSTAITTVPLLTAAGGFVNTDFHCLEYRFVPATTNANGLVKFLVDGVELLRRSFGVVADDLPLPSSPNANNNNGYVVNVQNQSRNTELDVALVRVQRAQSEFACL